MKTRLFLLFAAAMIVMAMSVVNENKPNPKEILKKTEEQSQGKSSKGKMTIETIRPKWSTSMTLTSWSLGTEYALTIINEPAKNKGIGTLKRDKEVWMWYPKIESLTKLPPSMMSQSWMGTDFSNDDLINQSSLIDDYSHEMGKDSTIEKRTCWKITLTPKEDSDVIWGKIEMWIDQKDYLQLLTKFYDEDDVLVSKMEGSNIKEMGGRTMATKLVMTPIEKEGHKTIMTYNELEFDIDIEENFFTPQQLKRIRP
ncbi:MAG: outer membrane lipoprotein-sorting protein [Bacteroidetes bacterium]|nr:outer membrane lipoprotein-sorting protein [Bacteroidota bacterium]